MISQDKISAAYEAEYSLIAYLTDSFVREAPATAAVVGIVKPDMFLNAALGKVYGRFVDMLEAGNMDAIAVFHMLREEGVEVDMYANGTDENCAAFAKLIRELHDERRLVLIAQQIIGMANEKCAGAGIKAVRASEMLLDQAANNAGGFADMDGVIRKVKDFIIERNESGAELAGVPTGWSMFDAACNGLKGGKLYVLGGSPGMGKTIAALQVCVSFLTRDKNILFYSLEMTAEELVMRLTAQVSGVSQQVIERNLSSHDGGNSAPRVAEALHMLGARKGQLHVRGMENFGDNEDASALQIISDFRSLANRKKRPDIVIIDYIGLMEHEIRKGENLASSIGRTTRRLKKLANRWNVPVLMLAQINRAAMGRTDPRPQLSDLRDSGAIEQDADMVAFVYRDSVLNPQTPLAGVAEVLIRKNRSGPLSCIPLADRADCYRFDNPDDDTKAQYLSVMSRGNDDGMAKPQGAYRRIR